MFYKLTRYLSLPRYETLYCLFDPFSIPWRAKVGISQDHEIRKGQVEQSVKYETGIGVELRCFGLPVLFARQNEKFVHWLFKRLQWNGIRSTNGGSEWFWSINILTFAIAWVGFWWYGVEAAKWKAVFLLLLPVPLDHFFVIVVLALVQYAAVLVAIYSLFYFTFC